MWPTLSTLLGKLTRKNLPRRRPLAFCRPSLELLEDRLAPATLTVTSSGDTGANTLRAALAAANSGDVIDFAATVRTIDLTSAGLTIATNVTIQNDQGTGPVTIDGGGNFTVFTVNSGLTAALSGLTIQDGNAGASIYGGGGISNYGALTVSDSTLSRNTAYDGGGIANYGTLSVSNSTLSNNAGDHDGGAGGGIVNGGTLTVIDSTLSNNAAYDGGGIFNGEDGTLTISGSTLSGNSGFNAGGGVNNDAVYSTMAVIDSTFSANLADDGGGICNEGTALTVVNSTLADNTAYVFGGAVFNTRMLTTSNTTVAANSGYIGGGIATVEGGNTTLNNTIVADSTSGGDFYLDSGYSSTVSGSYDLIGDGSYLSSFTHSLQGDPLLAPLGSYGGPTQTMALLPGGPAIDAGSNGLIPTDPTTGQPYATDQRGAGFPRVVNGTVDIGAFESNGASLSSLLSQALSPSYPITVQANTTADADTVISAVNQLPSYNTPVTVTVNLAAGATYGDVTASPPSGVTLVINGQGGTTTIVGSSPALTVSSGNVIVTGMTLTTATDAPTILVTGGSLQLRNDDIESSTGSAQAAISLTGGSLDLGTAMDPGGNVLNINGTGTWFQNTTSNPILFSGDTFEIDGTAQSVVTWTGADGNGEWDDANNWQDSQGVNRLPGPSDVALVTQSGITIVHDEGVNDSVYSVQSQAALTLSAGSLALAAPSTLYEGFTWSGGTLTGGGTLTVAPTGTLTIEGGGHVLAGATLTNLGTATWTGGNVNLAEGAVFNNAGTLTLEVSAASFTSMGGAGTFNNSGTFIQASESEYGMAITATGNNSGVVQVQRDFVELTGGGGSSGSFCVAAGADLEVAGQTLSSGSSVTGAGEVDWSSSTVGGLYNVTGITTVYGGLVDFSGTAQDVGQSLAISNNATADFEGNSLTTGDLTLSGTLQGGGAWAVTTAMDWQSGTLGGGGALTVGPAGTLTIEGGGHVLAGATLTNLGTATWTGGNVNLAEGAVFNNAGTLTLEVSAASFTSMGGAGTFNNSGTFIQASESEYGMAITATGNNSGVVQVQRDFVELTGGGGSSGSFCVAAGADLEVAGQTLSSGSSVTGAGEVDWSSSTVGGLYNVTGITTVYGGLVDFSGTAQDVGQSLAISNNATADFEGNSLTTGDLTLSGTLQGGGAWAVTTAMDWQSGTLGGGGALTVGPAGTLTIEGGGHVLAGATLTNLGTATWTGGNVNLAEGAVFNNAGTLTLEVSAASFTSMGGAGTFNNSGTFIQASESEYGMAITATGNNSGVVQVQRDFVELTGGGGSSGSFCVAAGADLEVAGQTLSSGSSVTGAGEVDWSSSTVGGLYNVTGITTVYGGLVDFSGTAQDVGQSLAISNNATADFSPAAGGPVTLTLPSLTLAGTLQGSDDFTVSGAFDWQYGSLNGPAGSVLTAEGGITLQGGGNMSVNYGRALVNAPGQTAVWQGGNLLIDGADGSSFVNSAGAAFNDLANGAYCNGGAFVNEGTFTAALGSGGFQSLAVSLDNTGAFSVLSGSMQIGGANTNNTSSGGMSDSDPDGGLTFVGNWDFTDTSSLSAAQVGFYAANVTIAGGYDATLSTQLSFEGTVAFTGAVASVGALYINFSTADFSPAAGGPVTLNLPSLTLAGTLQGSDDFTVSGAFDWQYGSLNGPAGSVLTAEGGITLQGGGNMSVNYGRALVNAPGQTAVWQGGNLLIDGADGSSFVNSAGAAFNDLANGAYCNGGAFVNEGTFTAALGSGGFQSLAVSLDNTGAFSVLSGSMQIGGANTNNTSSGSIVGDQGTVLYLVGMFTLTPTATVSADQLILSGTLVAQIDGDTPGNGYGQITVGNSAALSGGLSLVMENGYMPASGTVLTLLEPTGNATIQGTFTNGPTVSAPGVASNGWQYTTLYTLAYNNDVELISQGSLTVTPNQSAVVTSGIQPATNTGAYTSPAGPVTLTASLGVVVNNGNGTWSWSYTPNDGPTQTQTVTITATDPDGNVATTTFSLTLYHAAPTASLSGPSAGVLYQPLTFTLGATDLSPIDQAGNFTYAINWGDGTNTAPDIQTIVGPSPTTLTHVYNIAGTYPVTLTATDQDGVVSPSVSQPVAIVATPQLQNGVLAIPGTAVNATFTLTPTLPTGAAAYSMKVTRTIGTTTTNLGTFTVPIGTIEVYGGPGTDALTLNGTVNNDAFTIGNGTVSELAAQDTTQATAFSVGLNAIPSLTLKGDGGSDNLTGPNQANTWDLTAANAGTLDSTISFSGIQNLTGGSAADYLAFTTSTASVSGLIDGGGGANTLDFSGRTTAVTVTMVAGGPNKATATGGWTNIGTVIGGNATNTLVGANTANVWDVTGANAGTLDNALTFSGFENLTGGSVDDTFTFLPGGSLAGNLKGGAPTNTLDYSQYGSPVTVNLATKTATGIGGTWANIQVFNGTGTTDTLIGTNANSIWSLSGIDAGTVAGFTFAGFANLTGGTGNNVFQFGAGASVSGVIDGGTGTNTLDYSLYTSGVYVNLQTLAATGTGGIANIQNVTGSAVGGDILVGDGGSNVLTEHAGDNLVIGGGGSDTLTGGSGSDILIAGSTIYDQNVAALDALLSTWDDTTLSYDQRVADLLSGVSYTDDTGTQTAALDADSTVSQPAGSAPSTLKGGSSGLDWFFAAVTDVVKNQKKGEIVSTL